MFPHHQSTIERVTDAFSARPEVEAVLLGGSIAHGFAQENSDIDIMILVSEDEHARRAAAGDLHYFNTDLSTYAGGYIDGKYICRSFLNQVERMGSEPARFAFADAQVLFSRSPDLADQLPRIARYPVEEKLARISRFHAQFEGWRWYVGEAVRQRDGYLMGVAVTRLLLFGGRMILAHNETLYPYHKWFFKVLDRVVDKPEGLMDVMRLLSRHHTLERAAGYYDLVMQWRDWEVDSASWPNRLWSTASFPGFVMPPRSTTSDFRARRRGVRWDGAWPAPRTRND
ncbi:MAG: nucleotidyltransferase domain-containing protein [Capsulimonadaceae bacterium]